MTRGMRGVLTALGLLATSAGLGRAWAAKPNTYPVVPLVVTVAASDSAGNACRICDDGAGAYTDGIDGVAASLDQYGNLIIDFNATATPLARRLQFDYSEPADESTFVPPVAQNSYMSTIGATGGAIQAMDVQDVQCVQSNIVFTDGDTRETLYRHHFHRPLRTFDVADTSWLVVTRIGERVWEVEPKESGCNDGVASLARLFSSPTKGGRTDYSDRGAWYMPFKMTLTSK